MIAIYGFAAVFIAAVPLGDELYSVCSGRQGLDDLENSTSPATAIGQACTADFPEYPGVFTILENKHLPIPSGFIIDSDNRRYRLAMLPHDELLSDPEWPYTKLIIGSLDQSPAGVERGRVEVIHSGVPFGSEECDFSLRVNSYGIYLENGTFFQHATELRLSQSVVVMFGGGPELLYAMAEAFVRINCLP